MMMPANYSAIAENEMTYVVGGGIADVLAPVMNAQNWQNFNKNVIMLIGNSFLDRTVENTLGVLFKREYQFGNVFKAVGDGLTAAWNGGLNGKTGVVNYLNAAFNGTMQIVGGLASIYALGNGTVGLFGDISKSTIWDVR